MLYWPEGMTRQNDRTTYPFTLSFLKDAAENHRILEGTAILCDSKHNLLVDLGFTKGIIPREEGAIGIREGVTRDIAMISRVNKTVSFIVTGFTDDGTPLLSRRLAQEMCRREYIKKLRPGDIIPAIATHFEPFGCFVDIGCGIASLIPIDSISVSRIMHPKDRFSIGQEIFAVVKSIETDGKICLSHKELLGTWEENAAKFHAGETVGGIIRSVESYGIFVELTPNLAGLAEYKPEIFPGQLASVYIKSLLPEKMKIKLIIVDAFDKPHAPLPIEYFQTGGNIQSWQYSPNSSNRLFKVNFSGESAVIDTKLL